MRTFATIFLLLLSFLRSLAQEGAPTEYQVKAAFILNFAKFVEWPPQAFPDSSAPLVIGVLGDDPFGPHLVNTVRGKMLNGRAIVVRECGGKLEIARGCHVLFVSSSENHRLAELFGGLAGAPVLTVGETGEFTQTGGAISFFLEGNKIRFEIAEQSARRAGLRIDSKLLGLAKKRAA
jgi:hypothetical protein